MTLPRRPSATLLASLGLLAAVAAVYGQVAAFPFLVLDDRTFLRDNPALQEGLTAASVRWAFTTDLDAGWIPVTWLSRLLDVTLFGMDAGGHHAVNALLHGANALLLLLFLRRTTGRLRESAFAAALFAVHPLNVSTVAWVIERKEILCFLFVVLSLHAYARYAEAPGRGRMAAVAALFLLALLSKPMAVTLPFLLLVLDVWPLGRLRRPAGGEGGEGAPPSPAGPFSPAGPGRLLAEKAPLFALSAAASVVTWLSEAGAGVLSGLPSLPLRTRLANAAWSAASYLRKAAWPSDLSFFYPHPGDSLPASGVALSVLLLAAATAAALRYRRRLPFLATGWFWFLGTLVPVAGLVQAGTQGMADHYTYLPAVGLWVGASWGGAAALASLRPRKGLAAALAAVLLLALAGSSRLQAGDYGEPERLFRRAAAVTERNWLAVESLGILELEAGRLASAEEHFRQALRLHPGAPGALNHLGIVSARTGRTAEAEGAFRMEAARDPRSVDARYNLGLLLQRRGADGEAAEALGEALRIDPSHGRSHALLGVVLFRQGRRDEAALHFSEAVRARPRDAEANNFLGVYLSATGREEEAVERYRAAVRHRPWYAEAHHNLAMALLRTGGGEEQALRHLREALRIDGSLVEGHNNLGVLLARRGEREEAARHFREALRLRPGHEGARRNLERVLAEGRGGAGAAGPAGRAAP